MEDDIDILILVNWIHDYSAELLNNWLTPLLPHTRYLVLDAINPENPLNYQYAHDFSFLAGRAERIRSVRPENEGRQFHLYKVAT